MSEHRDILKNAEITEVSTGCYANLPLVSGIKSAFGCEHFGNCHQGNRYVSCIGGVLH